MAGLAEETLTKFERRPWGRWLLIGTVGILVVAGIATGLRALVGQSAPAKRQVARISILPDTPPPPPPPKREDKPPEPPKTTAKEVKLDPPKPVQAPPAPSEQLKMDGPAGDGPSAIAAGPVTRDYAGGALGAGGGASAVLPARSGQGIGRAAFSAYQLELQALIQEQLARLPALKQRDYRLPALVRLDERQQVQSVSLSGSSGSDEVDQLVLAAVRSALQQRPPPGSTPYRDFTIRVSNRLLH